MSQRNLDALLTPRSVALIGASARPGSVGNTIARNLVRGSFEGEMAFVNPGRREIEGRTCHASIAALPFVPDLAIVATPAATIPDMIGELAARGTRAAVVVSAGLNAALTQRMLDAGRKHLFRILGPNGIGLILPRLGLDASFSHRAPEAGELAFVSQSGALVTAVLDWAAEHHIGFSHVISVGNMADVDFGDLLDYLAGDPGCRAILLYMEAVTEAPKFLSAARRAARAKPVVVIKSGRHETAARAAASHTGRLASADAVYAAAFQRAGILRVIDLPELFEAAQILARVPSLSGERLLIMTNGGGAGVLAADRLADFGGELAELSPQTLAALDKVLPAAWSRANPVDIIGDADAVRTVAALDILLTDPAASAVLVINCPTALSSSTAIAEAVTARVKIARSAAGAPKTVLTNWIGGIAAHDARQLFATAGIASFETPEAAARGFMHLVRYTRAQEALLRTPAPMRAGVIDRDGAARIIAGARAQNRAALTGAEATALLAAYGIPVVGSQIAATPVQAGDIARQVLAVHRKVALKIHSPDISHKSDVGGVRLGLVSGEEVTAAATAMLAHVRALRPDARQAGFTISPMIEKKNGHELILGLSVDPTFGPVILFGAGGTAVEVMRDSAMALPPLDMQLARDLMRQTRVHRLLEGYRDRPAADLDAIADILVRVGQLAADHPALLELDINPLLADDTGVVALDARAVILRPTDAPRTAMAIRPYPMEWEKTVPLAGHGDIRLRPIRPEDERLYEAFMQRIAPEDHRLRFFSAKQPLRHRFLARLTQIDYARDMAFVALPASGDELLGVARYSADPDRLRAEYAVLVRSDLKGRGLGWALMQHLVAHARVTGVGTLFGAVLADNTTMLRMCRELGFAVKASADDYGVLDVTLDLAAGSSNQHR